MELVDEPFDGRDEAELVKDGRTELEGHGVGVIDGVLEEVACVFKEGAVDVVGKGGAKLAESELAEGKSLADAVVKVDGEATTLVLFDEDKLGCHGPEAGLIVAQAELGLLAGGDVSHDDEDAAVEEEVGRAFKVYGGAVGPGNGAVPVDGLAFRDGFGEVAKVVRVVGGEQADD